MDPSTGVVLVTGSGAGIGRATVERFARRGATVLATDKDVTEAEATADRLADAPGTVHPKQLDVRNRADFDEAIEYLEAEHGPITALVNNAGIRNRGMFLDASEADLREALDVNVFGTWNGCQAVIPSMLEAGGGAVVNVASIAAFLGWEMNAIYCLTKGAILNFTRSLAKEFSAHGVRVNAVCPGVTRTGVLESLEDAGMRELYDVPDEERLVDEIVEQYPMGRLADPGEIADAIVYLASDDASFVTGHGLVVDGGYSIW